MFDRVVRIHVTLNDAETERALDTFVGHGWPARALVNQAPMVEVDVGVTGARSRSVGHATELLRRECARTGLPIVVRAAWLVREASPALREYAVFRSRSDHSASTRRSDRIGSAMERALVELGLSDTGAKIYAPTLREAMDELRVRHSEMDPTPLPGRPLDVRRPLHTPTDDTAGVGVMAPPDDIRLRIGVLASFLALFLLGAGIGAGDVPLWASLLIIGFGAPLTAMTTWRWAGTVRVRRQWTGAAAMTGVQVLDFAAGFVFGRITEENAVERALQITIALVLALGAWHLLRSPLRRTAAWLVPIALSLSVPTAAMLGRITYGAYLDEFGLRVDAVDRDAFAYVVAALEPAALILLSALIVLGIAGWTTYFFIEGTVPLIVLAIAATSLSGITSAIHTGQVEAERAMAAASAREDVPNFFGIQPSWVCARPVNGSIPTVGSQLPTNRPILWLGDTGDRAALWDPDQRGAIRLALSDAILLEVAADTTPCPS